MLLKLGKTVVFTGSETQRRAERAHAKAKAGKQSASKAIPSKRLTSANGVYEAQGLEPVRAGREIKG